MRITARIVAALLIAGSVSARNALASQTVGDSNAQAPASQKPSNSQTPPSASKSKAAAPKAKVATPTAKSPVAAAKTSASVKTSQVAAKTPQGAVKSPQSAQKSPFVPKVAKAEDKSKAPASAKQTPPVTAKPSSPTTAKVEKKAPAPAVTQAAKKPAPPAPTKPANQTATTAAPATPPPAATTPVAQNPAPAKLPSPGKRDPFQNPITAAALRGPANCTSGKHCLLIDQIALKGIVQMKSGNIALVENAARRPYFLHENDALFNGSVVKITGDTVVFKEDSSDILGRPVSKEVIKKVSAPAV